jgi:3-hydroxy-9,10-secoandrosta-1,3,5(10)-triene-9,17-dione monooxygenase reductase component
MEGDMRTAAARILSTPGQGEHDTSRPALAKSCDPEQFRQVASRWASSVAVITTADESGRLFGLTMTAVTSLSVEPLQYLICLDERSETLSAILASGRFCINFLGSRQMDVSNAFASKAAEKFRSVSYKLIESGVPVLDDSLAFIECSVATHVRGGDHRIIIGDVVQANWSEAEPLLYYRGHYRNIL